MYLPHHKYQITNNITSSKEECRIRIILLMGVSGSGKTTLGKTLARHLGWHFVEADDFHPLSNIAKMGAGTPLNDADRGPWLAALHHHLKENLAAGTPVIIACSALRKIYREQLFLGLPPRAVGLVYLHGSREVLAARLAARRDHFMPRALLDSQLATLESPCEEEYPLVIDIIRAPCDLAQEICQHFALISQ